jgi:hypothetical protein
MKLKRGPRLSLRCWDMVKSELFVDVISNSASFRVLSVLFPLDREMLRCFYI